MSLPVITSAGQVEIVIDAGSDWGANITLTDEAGGPVDLLDATGGTLHIHRSWRQRSTIDPEEVLQVPVTITSAPAGTLHIGLTAAQSAALQDAITAQLKTTADRDVAALAYELEITDGTLVRRVLEGSLIVSRRGQRA
jgi:hypothetical protein